MGVSDFEAFNFDPPSNGIKIFLKKPTIAVWDSVISISVRVRVIFVKYTSEGSILHTSHLQTVYTFERNISSWF